MTPEERAAEKLHQQKLQEEADLKAAMDTFGEDTPRAASPLGNRSPTYPPARTQMLTKPELSVFTGRTNKCGVSTDR